MGSPKPNISPTTMSAPKAPGGSLIKLANGVATARQFLQVALTASRKHFQWEERLLFPLIEKMLKPETLAELGQACMDRTTATA